MAHRHRLILGLVAFDFFKQVKNVRHFVLSLLESVLFLVVALYADKFLCIRHFKYLVT
jgi:hypothetical protein